MCPIWHIFSSDHISWWSQYKIEGTFVLLSKKTVVFSYFQIRNIFTTTAQFKVCVINKKPQQHMCSMWLLSTKSFSLNTGSVSLKKVLSIVQHDFSLCCWQHLQLCEQSNLQLSIRKPVIKILFDWQYQSYKPTTVKGFKSIPAATQSVQPWAAQWAWRKSSQ